MPLSLAGKAAAALIAISSVGAYELSPPDWRGQTVFLERLASRIDQAHTIAPDTATRITELLARVRVQHPRAADIEARRQEAIARVENALQTKASVAARPA